MTPEEEARSRAYAYEMRAQPEGEQMLRIFALVDASRAETEAVRRERDEAIADRDRFAAVISRPYIGAWTDEVVAEAAHQRERWGEADAGKAPADWFWLVGFLSGKCLAAHIAGDLAKARHHTVSTGAALAHWAASITGAESVFRPGHGEEFAARARALGIGEEREKGNG